MTFSALCPGTTNPTKDALTCDAERAKMLERIAELERALGDAIQRVPVGELCQGDCRPGINHHEPGCPVRSLPPTPPAAAPERCPTCGDPDPSRKDAAYGYGEPCTECGTPPRLKPAPVSATPRWRVGTKLGRTLYRDGVCVGMLDTPELAREVVAALNAAPVSAATVEDRRCIHGIPMSDRAWDNPHRHVYGCNVSACRPMPRATPPPSDAGTEET